MSQGRTGQHTYLEAAIAVLESTGRAMTLREITDEALQRGFIAPAGKTPEATMSAVLYTSGQIGETRLRRIFEPGPTRARRGSVRWIAARRAASRHR